MNTFYFPRLKSDLDAVIILKPREKDFHLNNLQVIRDQVKTAEAMLIEGSISGSQLKKIKAECYNLEQNYKKRRGLYYVEVSGSLAQEIERYEEEKFPEENSPEAGTKEGRPGEGSPVNLPGEDGRGEELLESSPSKEGSEGVIS